MSAFAVAWWINWNWLKIDWFTDCLKCKYWEPYPFEDFLDSIISFKCWSQLPSIMKETIGLLSKLKDVKVFWCLNKNASFPFEHREQKKTDTQAAFWCVVPTHTIWYQSRQNMQKTISLFPRGWEKSLALHRCYCYLEINRHSSAGKNLFVETYVVGGSREAWNFPAVGAEPVTLKIGTEEAL